MVKFKDRLQFLCRCILGGATGAVLTICFTLLFVLVTGCLGTALPYFGFGGALTKWERTWSEERVFGVITALGVAGFVLGIVFASQFPNRIRKWSGLAALLSVPVICLGSCIFVYSRNVEFPRSVKLAACSRVTSIQFTVPKGRYYRLILSGATPYSNTLSGHINIASGQTAITNFTVVFDQTGLLCTFFKAQSNYNLEIQFDQPPPPSSSIWLNWLQPYKDLGKQP